MNKKKKIYMRPSCSGYVYVGRIRTARNIDGSSLMIKSLSSPVAVYLCQDQDAV